MTQNGTTRDQLIDLASTYFAAVDAEDIDAVLATLTEDCRLSVETHGVALTDHEEIRNALEKLWEEYAAVLHDNFQFVVDPSSNRIAAQFRVVNTHKNGETEIKSNCNFFVMRDGRIASMAIYMEGENTVKNAGG